jgi:hypothetical protein
MILPPMKHYSYITAFFASSLLAQAALTSNLVSYYNFDQSGSGGLANQVNPGTFDAVFNGSTGTGSNLSGSGFTGNASFNGGDGLSNRPVLSSTLGGVLNLVDSRGNFISTGISSATVGENFSISLWFALTPGATNNSNRYHLLESSNNYNVSFGTNSVAGTITAPSANYNYLTYINQSTGTVSANSVATSSWHHAALVYSATTVTVYVDGTSRGNLTFGTGGATFSDLLFGRERNNPDGAGDRDWDGMIDELAIWDRALTASEINNANTGTNANSLYQRGLAGLPIPEPAATLLGALSTLLLLRRRNR